MSTEGTTPTVTTSSVKQTYKQRALETAKSAGRKFNAGANYLATQANKHRVITGLAVAAFVAAVVVGVLALTNPQALTVAGNFIKGKAIVAYNLGHKLVTKHPYAVAAGTVAGVATAAGLLVAGVAYKTRKDNMDYIDLKGVARALEMPVTKNDKKEVKDDSPATGIAPVGEASTSKTRGSSLGDTVSTLRKLVNADKEAE